MAIVTEAYGYKQMSASANVSTGPSTLGGIFCSTSTAGTVTVYDDASTGTATKMVDTFSLVPGQYFPLPFGASAGLNVVIGGTASITVGFVRT